MGRHMFREVRPSKVKSNTNESLFLILVCPPMVFPTAHLGSKASWTALVTVQADLGLKDRIEGMAGVSRRHSWEDAVAPRYEWQDPPDVCESSEEGYDSEPDSTPGTELFDYLIQQHRQGSLTAKQVCIIAHHAARGGMKELEPIALPPSTLGSGDFKRLLDKVLQCHGPDTYVVEAPAFIRNTGGKGSHAFHCILPHEGLAMELAGMDLEKLHGDWDAPPNYHNHPVVEAAAGTGTPVVPLSLFLDGVAYAKRDSVLVASFHNLWTGKRVICLAIRRRLLCRCSCRGWDALCALFAFLRWCVQILADGRSPAFRHDGSEWDLEVDGARAEVAGQPLPFKAAVCQLRADWAEIAHTLAVPQWSSARHPCFLCKASRADVYTLLGECSATHFPWELKTHQDYEAACANAERTVRLEEWSWTRLAELLQPDHRKDGPRGYALSGPVPELALLKGDRLDPTAELWWDVEAFWGERQPEHAVLWRRSREGMSLRRNPLLDPELGLTLERVVAVDVLHTLCLGVFMQFVHGVLWHLVENLPMNQGLPLRANVREENLTAMRLHYRKWLKWSRKSRPEVQLTAVGDFTLEMLGNPGVPSLRAKAHETLTLLRWVHALLAPIQGRLPNGVAWTAGAHDVESMWDLLSTAPMVVPRDVEQDQYMHGGSSRRNKPMPEAGSAESETNTKKNLLGLHGRSVWTATFVKEKNPQVELCISDARFPALERGQKKKGNTIGGQRLSLLARKLAAFTASLLESMCSHYFVGGLVKLWGGDLSCFVVFEDNLNVHIYIYIYV